MCREQIIRFYVALNIDIKYSILAYTSYVLGIIILLPNTCNAIAESSGNIIEGTRNLLIDLQKTVLTISTAAAVCGIGYGTFLKSIGYGTLLNRFGRGIFVKLEAGNKFIVNSIWGWVIINGAFAILNFLSGYISPAKANNREDNTSDNVAG